MTSAPDSGSSAFAPTGTDGTDPAGAAGSARRRWLPGRDLTRTLVVFLALTLVISAICDAIQELSGFPTRVFNLAAVGPALAAYLTMKARRWAPAGVWRPGFGLDVRIVRRSILLFFVGVGIVFLTMEMYQFRRLNVDPLVLSQFDIPPFGKPGAGWVMVAIVVGLFATVALEELGWRSFLQPTLRTRYPLLVSAVLTGLVAALWQWPMTKVGALKVLAAPVLGLLFLAAFVVSQVCLSIVIAVVQRPLRQGYWLTAVMLRWSYSVGFAVLLDEDRGKLLPMTAIAFACLCAAAVAVYYYRTWYRRHGHDATVG
ncbi:CPBP family intramembrane glutamic endopeptidase [Granulicoccus phenolivorans]|uniref:CPBP family intramembrane glutamic endopeptidase n=1 Tax=Granulicoccus phenolivorans TaxID=266854 RepID=UPI0003FAE5B8|nr:CPBP family intramembrane glutamic endopeptidase [Granulicoccus phenolivorans]